MASILLIDDSRELIDALRLLLEMEGQAVKTARTGADALALLETGLMPDVIVCDYDLPGMDGITLLKQIRANPNWHDLRFIIVSGRRDLRPDALEAGANSFLDKPFPMHDFLNLVLSPS